MSSTSPSTKFLLLRSIRGQLLLVVGLFAMAMIALVAFQTWRGIDEVYSERRQQLRSVVEAAEKAVEGQYAAFQAGRISESEAQERAKAVVRSMHYNGAGYFFIQDDNIITIVHGARPDQEGVNGANQKDATGKYFSREMHKVASEQGEGFVNYEYAKPGAALDQASPKLSFIKFFAPWRWTVGTGVYIDDLNAKIRNELLLGSGLALALCLIIGLIAGRIIMRLANRLGALSAATAALAAGDLSREPPRVTGADEVDRMTQALHVFYEAARARVALESTALSARKDAESSRAAFDAERAQKERSLEEAAQALGLGLERLAGGDLAGSIEVPFEGALDKLRLDFNSALQKLRQAMLSIRENADGIRSGVEEIAQASDDLSTRTEQQAAQHEKVATALEQIASALKNSADGVRDASGLVSVADHDAREGSVIVKDAVRAMGEISESSRKIAQIIGVIDEIAFQTNLLALNAGVEAARAGEAGKGFAVVASEVRALAQRSADAAKEIKTLISTSTSQVENGVSLVTKTGGGLESIIGRVSQINHVVADLARGAQEQSLGLQEVSGSVNEMDRVTQQNATMAEQANAASRSLAQETARLMELISVFNVGARDGLREELRKTVPHAFARPVAPPRAGARPVRV